MAYEIKWMGNQYTNYSSRNGHVPFVICDHISSSTMSSMDSWFTSSGNTVSSAHFGVSKAGEIHQYVDIKNMAWGNGTSIANYPDASILAQVAKDNYGTNVNLFSVSIEHEGTDGTLTEEQFQASVWLHNYIRDQIVEIYGANAHFELDNYHVVGHFQLSKLKPTCPGPNFPWERLYAALNSSVQSVQTEEEEDDMAKALEMSVTEWQQLAKALDGLFKAGKINDYGWAEKAYKMELTGGELARLGIILEARSVGVDC